MNDIDNHLNRALDAIRSDRLADAATEWASAKARLRGLDNDPSDARRHASIAYVARRMGEPELALHHYTEAAAIRRGNGDVLGCAHAIRHVGDIHRENVHLAASVEAYAEALALYRCEPTAPPLDLANCLRGYALLSEARGDASAVRSMWSEARELYASAGILEGVEECDRRMSLFANHPEPVQPTRNSNCTG